VRQIDYSRPETLPALSKRVKKLLLISSSEIGQRVSQHKAVVDAAKNAELIAYTSLLHADSSPLPLAAEHKETEQLLQASGLPVVLLRNGWYSRELSRQRASGFTVRCLAGKCRRWSHFICCPR
jgi:NAD(P)H dehydrogenase (quinone)